MRRGLLRVVLGVSGVGLVAGPGGGGAFGAVHAVQEVTLRDDNGNGALFTVDLEGNYLPNVVRRENGNASFEALKAQAVAARSFAYYKFGVGADFLRNSTADQVYSLGGWEPNPGGLWDLAVRETAGEILTFNNIRTAAFYVAGAIPSGSTPVAGPGDNDYSNTERYVTYTYENGLLGAFNTGTSLGFVGTPSNPNYPNRGAMSQNGADFQSDRGVHYLDILKYYYGGDIQVEQVIQGAGQTPFGVKPLAGFERNNDIFNQSLTYAGQTRALGGGTSVSRSESFARSGSSAQRLDFDYDAGADAGGAGFFSRHVSGATRARELSNVTSGTVSSGVADPVGNVILPSQGSIGFWLMVNPEDALGNIDLEVSIAIDDFENPYGAVTTEQGDWLDVIIDGAWHKYEWFLEDVTAWTSAFGPGVGDGLIASRFTLDSILFRGLGDVTVYLDDVFYDTAAVAPEPTTLAMALLAMAGGCGRRRGRK